MELKDRILETLERNKGRFVSGNELAGALHFSRNAVWKAVNALKSEGHAIRAVTNKGYCLEAGSDVLSGASISKHLGELADVFSVDVLKTIDSTNTAVKARAAAGAPEGTVIVAEEQTGGKGRRGRVFFSPAGTGIYFSILLRPSVKALDATLITTAAAVAVASAIEAVTGIEAKIKWVNDVFVSGKKVCGILTEGSFDMESGGLEYAVLGVGVNIRKPVGGYPAEISNVAGAIYESGEPEAETQSRLIAWILKMFWTYYRNLAGKSFLSEYKARSFIIGHEVDVISGDASRKARVLDIDDDCRLVVRYEDGAVEALSSGEVSIRPHDM
ncbi:MAG: biotin--[acetyl-CoA-carboxylase] ligase [Clostridiales bacterium]|nr:biotin--[acetyl-CoA-carboxylase] ligase [Clostridiales bacterium]